MAGNPKETFSRRGFLKLTGAGAVAAVVTVAGLPQTWFRAPEKALKVQPTDLTEGTQLQIYLQLHNSVWPEYRIENYCTTEVFAGQTPNSEWIKYNLDSQVYPALEAQLKLTPDLISGLHCIPRVNRRPRVSGTAKFYFTDKDGGYWLVAPGKSGLVEATAVLGEKGSIIDVVPATVPSPLPGVTSPGQSRPSSILPK